MSTEAISQRAARHVAAFNDGVRSGNWAAFANRFTPDATMRFIGVPAGPFTGREEIAAGYACQPPSDTLTVTRGISRGDVDELWFAASLPAGGGPHHAIASAVPVPVVRKGASASPTPSPPPAARAPTPCYRPAGTPVTITSAAVSSVFTYRPPPGQAGPDLYGFIVGVPGADVAAVTAVIRQAHNTGSAVGISVAGKLWQAPLVQRPFSGQRLHISLLSRNQALQFHRILVSSG